MQFQFESMSTITAELYNIVHSCSLNLFFFVSSLANLQGLLSSEKFDLSVKHF